MSRIFGRPSPAMVVAFAALIVALGGTSYAAIRLPKNSVGSKQIKRNAVSSTKIKNNSLKAVDFKAGELPTAFGTLAYRELTNTAPANSNFPIEVPCPPGLFAISGQIDASPGLEMQSSYSSDGQGTGAPGVTAWTGWVDNLSNPPTDLPFTVIVTCAPAGAIARKSMSKTARNNRSVRKVTRGK